MIPKAKKTKFKIRAIDEKNKRIAEEIFDKNNAKFLKGKEASILCK